MVVFDVPETSSIAAADETDVAPAAAAAGVSVDDDNDGERQSMADDDAARNSSEFVSFVECRRRR